MIQQARENYLSFRDVSKAQIIIQDLTASNRINQTLAPCMLVNESPKSFSYCPPDTQVSQEDDHVSGGDHHQVKQKAG